MQPRRKPTVGLLTTNRLVAGRAWLAQPGRRSKSGCAGRGGITGLGAAMTSILVLGPSLRF
jgi:hypothetical protein